MVTATTKTKTIILKVILLIGAIVRVKGNGFKCPHKHKDGVWYKLYCCVYELGPRMCLCIYSKGLESILSLIIYYCLLNNQVIIKEMIYMLMGNE